jgi:predicted MFS family arabinose efflux permease
MAVPPPPSSPSDEGSDARAPAVTNASTRSSGGPRRRFTGLLVPLQRRNFRLLFSGQLISVIGDQFFAVALPWFVLSSGGGPQDLGLVLAAYGVPRVVTIALGGALSDRLRPRRVMLLADAARTVLVGGVAVLALLSRPPLWQLCVLAAPLGAFTGLFLPASWSITPDVLPEAELQAGNALEAAWTQTAILLGPGLGGLIVARFSPGIALALDAGSFVISAFTLVRMTGGSAGRAYGAKASPSAADQGNSPDGRSAVGERPPTFRDLLRRSPLLRWLLVISAFTNFAFGGLVFGVALPALAKGPLAAGATGYGFMLAAFGAGALVGGAAAGLAGNLSRPGVMVLVLFLVMSVAMMLIPGAGALAGVPGVAADLAVMGVTNGLGNVTYVTGVQRRFPRELLGRIMGALALTNYGLYPLSVAVAGVAVGQYGPGWVIVAGGALTSLAVAVALFSPEMREF